MGYIDMMNEFWKINKEQHFTPNEIALFFALADIANKLYWKKKNISVPNGTLTKKINCSRHTLERSRERLKQTGVIAYKPGHSRKAPLYRITLEAKNDLQESMKAKNDLQNEKDQNHEGHICPSTSPLEAKFALKTDFEGPNLDTYKKKDIIQDTRSKTSAETKNLVRYLDGKPRKAIDAKAFLRGHFGEKAEHVIERLQIALGNEFDDYVDWMATWSTGAMNLAIDADEPVARLMQMFRVGKFDYQIWRERIAYVGH